MAILKCLKFLKLDFPNQAKNLIRSASQIFSFKSFEFFSIWNPDFSKIEKNLLMPGNLIYYNLKWP